MQQVDDRILEHLDEDGWSTPKIMHSKPEFQSLSASKRRIR